MVNSLELANVTKEYPGLTAVDDVSFNMPEGCLMALVGHNGAGKSTLIKLMLGLIRPTSGHLSVLGEDPATSKATKARSRVGFLPESVAFEGAMTGREVLSFFAKLKGENVTKSMELFDLVGLEYAVDNKIKTYSKGMRQRLGLAQALLGKPEVLFLDEPTSGLDPAAQRHFYDIVKGLKADGASILICSHALTELEAQADLVAMMNSGHMMACASLDELRQKADIPTQVRIRVTEGMASIVAEKLTGNGTPTYVNGSHVELAISNAHKMLVLKQVSDLGADIIDVDVQAPSLDKLYASFCQREEAGR